MFLKNALDISHRIIEMIVAKGDAVVDATAGNGNDTLFLAKLVGLEGKVFAFDIQDMALENTRKRLADDDADKSVILIKDSHENMDMHVPKGIKAVMFNLGYLPGGDHSVGTKAASTIKAIEKSLALLEPGGVIMIAVYYGGDSGFDEKEAIMEYVKSIDYKKAVVLVHEFVNQINCPPIAICIEKCS
ncbi:class I SAM-dependent methyltransferase [Lutispora saccharofermentans]|uniref:Class I SAM-dependent methyltransferase n=1 Tax=Lutispora saccharofermentans TaxID=3024236 RepID=A0ABT1N9U0_9FIRM|nr:class I SAM-dependent methyltransferase [Lutispora saccharofermentans]MCQ1528015.1 class I SAM-dependent methyltransferase [Lutispora saccharofermentans]